VTTNELNPKTIVLDHKTVIETLTGMQGIGKQSFLTPRKRRRENQRASEKHERMLEL